MGITSCTKSVTHVHRICVTYVLRIFCYLCPRTVPTERPNHSPDCVKGRSIHQMIDFSPHRTGQLRREIRTAQAERLRNRDFSPPLIFRRAFFSVSRWSGPEMLGESPALVSVIDARECRPGACPAAPWPDRRDSLAAAGRELAAVMPQVKPASVNLNELQEKEEMKCLT